MQFVLAMATNDTVLCRPSSVLTARALARAIFYKKNVSAGFLSLLRHLVDYFWFLKISHLCEQTVILLSLNDKVGDFIIRTRCI